VTYFTTFYAGKSRFKSAKYSPQSLPKPHKKVTIRSRGEELFELGDEVTGVSDLPVQGVGIVGYTIVGYTIAIGFEGKQLVSQLDERDFDLELVHGLGLSFFINIGWVFILLPVNVATYIHKYKPQNTKQL